MNLTEAQLDERTPGLFTPEMMGHLMVCVKPKCYLIMNKDEMKLSCKGIQKNKFKKKYPDIVEQFLASVDPKSFNIILAQNRGFKKVETEDGWRMQYYEMDKKALDGYYDKRKVIGYECVPNGL